MFASTILILFVVMLPDVNESTILFSSSLSFTGENNKELVMLDYSSNRNGRVFELFEEMIQLNSNEYFLK